MAHYRGMFKSKNALLFGSVGLIVLAITVSSILERTKQPTTNEDVRTRASATGSLQMTGTVATIDDTKGVITVDGIQFHDLDGSKAKNLGTWTVTLPPNANLGALYPGAKVLLTVNPTTFLAATHTLTATEIKIQR